MYVIAPDGTREVYGHLDPASIPWREGDEVRQGFHLGRYASPPTGRATGPHVHYAEQDAEGNWIQPGTAPMPAIDGQVVSTFGTRVDPFTQKRKMHNGIDVRGRQRWRSSDELF